MQKARFIDPPNILRQKVGNGGIDPLRIRRAEDFIDENPVDFVPLANEIMARLDNILAQAKSGKLQKFEAIDMLTRPIMELKANGSMFKYVLVSEIAGIILNFLENISSINDDVYEIIEAHQTTLQVIIQNKLVGGGGERGRALAQELYGACRRYYTKHNIVPIG